MLCKHGNLQQSCYECDLEVMTKAHCSGFVTTTAWLQQKKDYIDRKAKELYDREMVMRSHPKPKKKKVCDHEAVNYITDGKGDLTVWCRECGENVPKERAKQAKLEIYKETSKEEPEHELDVIQRLSEAYRANEREIEAEISDESKKKELGTIYTGK